MINGNPLTKESRISFRISEEMEDRINNIIRKHRSIRNKSDFGVKALEHYASLLEGRDISENQIEEALLYLAKQSGSLDKVKRILEKNYKK